MQKKTILLICMIFILTEQCLEALADYQEKSQNIFPNLFPPGIDKLKAKINNIPIKELKKMLILLNAAKYLDYFNGYKYTKSTSFSKNDLKFNNGHDINSHNNEGHQITKQYSNENILNIINILQEELERRGRHLDLNWLFSNQLMNETLENDFGVGNLHENNKTYKDEKDKKDIFGPNHPSINLKKQLVIESYRYRTFNQSKFYCLAIRFFNYC